jgi:hypothetical protein
VPNPDPEPAAPIPEEPVPTDAARADAARHRRSFALSLVAGLVAVGGAIAACHNEIPGPQGPLPSPMREVPPQGPKPQPIMPGPAPRIGSLDASVPITSTSQGGAASSPARLTIPVNAVAQNDNVASDPPPPTQPPAQPPSQNPPANPPNDGGVVDSTADLPSEVPDAGQVALPDAGQPLRR